MRTQTREAGAPAAGTTSGHRAARVDPGLLLTLAAGAVLALETGVRGWVALRGYYYLDDFVFTARAATHRALDPSYLLEPYNSHLMPGSYLWVWALTRLLPFNYTAVAVVSLALQLVLGLQFYALLRRLFGATPGILVPFSVFVLSPITLPASLWWSAALNQLPQQIAMAAALLAHVRYLRTGRLRHGLVGPLALLVGLAFSEKTLLVVPLVAGLTLLHFSTGGPLTRLREAALRHVRVWTAYAVVAVAFLGYYLTHVPTPVRTPGQGAGIVQLVLESFGRAVIPGLLGGPWSWAQIGYAGALEDTAPFAVGVALLVATGVVAGSCLLRRGAWMGWVLALGYAVLNLALLTASRAAFIGPVIANEYRYVTDVALVGALGLALATLPLAGRWRRASPLRLEPRPSVHGWFSHPAVGELRDALPRLRPAGGVALAVTALAASAMVSTVGYDRFWRINPARAYVGTASAELADTGPALVLANTYVPQDVAWPLLGSYALVGSLLSPLPHPPRTLADGPVADALFMLDPHGHVRRAAIDGIHATPGPEPGCGWRIGSGVTSVPLERATLPWAWTLRIGYVSSADTTAAVTVGQRSSTVALHRGLGAVFLPADGVIDVVSIGPVDAGASVCTDDVTVGAPVAVTGSAP